MKDIVFTPSQVAALQRADDCHALAKDSLKVLNEMLVNKQHQLTQLKKEISFLEKEISTASEECNKLLKKMKSVNQETLSEILKEHGYSAPWDGHVEYTNNVPTKFLFRNPTNQ